MFPYGGPEAHSLPGPVLFTASPSSWITSLGFQCPRSCCVCAFDSIIASSLLDYASSIHASRVHTTRRRRRFDLILVANLASDSVCCRRISTRRDNLRALRLIDDPISKLRFRGGLGRALVLR